jgi:hypothetical protein
LFHPRRRWYQQDPQGISLATCFPCCLPSDTLAWCLSYFPTTDMFFDGVEKRRGKFQLIVLVDAVSDRDDA